MQRHCCGIYRNAEQKKWETEQELGIEEKQTCLFCLLPPIRMLTKSHWTNKQELGAEENHMFVLCVAARRNAEQKPLAR